MAPNQGIIQGTAVCLLLCKILPVLVEQYKPDALVPGAFLLRAQYDIAFLGFPIAAMWNRREKSQVCQGRGIINSYKLSKVKQYLLKPRGMLSPALCCSILFSQAGLHGAVPYRNIWLNQANPANLLLPGEPSLIVRNAYTPNSALYTF